MQGPAQALAEKFYRRRGEKMWFKPRDGKSIEIVGWPVSPTRDDHPYTLFRDNSDALGLWVIDAEVVGSSCRLWCQVHVDGDQGFRIGYVYELLLSDIVEVAESAEASPSLAIAA
jgi:hypothetical protein